MVNSSSAPYRGRLAPSPTGLLHAGHARTFWTASERAHAAGGNLALRNDDLDTARCRPEFVAAMIEDLHWLGLRWDAPMLSQSTRIPLYRAALEQLHARGHIFPCSRSRRDVLAAACAPHDGDELDEPLYPAQFRPAPGTLLPPLTDPLAVNWRFRVPDGEVVRFEDTRLGWQEATAGRDFGDFLVWRKDDMPSYQLACVVDDAAMGITEVVRGADLVQSTFRQLLLYRALQLPEPRFHHCALMKDAQGQRLAKRDAAQSLRALRERGLTPEQVRSLWK